MAFNFQSINGYLWNWVTNAKRTAAQTFDQVSTGYYSIILPDTLQAFQSFVACKSSFVAGLSLRYEPSTPVQIYWDKRYFFYDLMTADQSVNAVLTMPTANFLTETGWYQVDEKYVFHINWGYHRGCDFLNRSVSSLDCNLQSPEFLNPVNSQACSADYLSKGSYALPDPILQVANCPIFKKVSSYFVDYVDCTDMNRKIEMDTMTLMLQEYFGPDSRCFNGKYKFVNMKLSNTDIYELPVCQKFQCYKENGEDKLRIIFDNQVVYCPKFGGNVTLSKGSSGCYIRPRRHY